MEINSFCKETVINRLCNRLLERLILFSLFFYIKIKIFSVLCELVEHTLFINHYR